MIQYTPRQRTEAEIQEQIIAYLRVREWMVKSTHGNAFQSGFPDLYATHAQWGPRWIEIKVATAFSFTPAQLREFPQFEANGTRIWIMTEATDSEYEKLFKPSNMNEFMLAFTNGYRDITKWRR